MVETRARKRQRLNKDEYIECKKIKIEEIKSNTKKKNEEKELSDFFKKNGSETTNMFDNFTPYIKDNYVELEISNHCTIM